MADNPRKKPARSTGTGKAKVPAKATKPAETTKQPAPPKGLRVGGKALWKSCHQELPESWRFDGRELWNLEAACQLRDTLDQLRAAIAKLGVTVKGSQGQEVVNPALAEARLTTAAIAQHLAKLDLPNEAGAPESPRTAQARKAAQVRWSRADNFSREALEHRRRRRGQAN